MVPYFGRHGAKQYIYGKTIKFGFKLWVMTTPLGCGIQFRQYTDKDTILRVYSDIGLGLGTSPVAHLIDTLPNFSDSNFHIAMDNFFTSPKLLRDLSSKQIAATGAIRTNRIKNTPLQDFSDGKRELKNIECCNWRLFKHYHWKDNKIVNALFTFIGKESIQSVKRFCNEQNKRVDIKQPNIMNIYNKSMWKLTP